jgi:hypothetical protein
MSSVYGTTSSHRINAKKIDMTEGGVFGLVVGFLEGWRGGDRANESDYIHVMAEAERE